MKALESIKLGAAMVLAFIVALFVAIADAIAPGRSLETRYVRDHRGRLIPVPAGGRPGLIQGLNLGGLGAAGRGLSRISQNILGIPPASGSRLPAGRRRTLTNASFMDIATPTDITTIVGTFVTMGDGTDDGFLVPAQQAFRWGFGVPSEGAGHNQGYVFLQFIDDTAGDVTNEDGVVRFIAADNDQIRTETLFQERTEELDGDANDINQRIPFPEVGPLLADQDLMIMRLNADAVDVIQPDFSVARIPCTLYQPYIR